MKKKSSKMSVVLLALALCLALTACAGKPAVTTGAAEPAGTTAGAAGTTAGAAETTAAETKAAAGIDYQVALVLPGTINDEGWNATAYRGLKKIEADGFKTAYTENVKTSDYESIYRGYAGRGFNLIVGHGFEFMDPAKAVAPDYPNIWFAVTSTTAFMEPNVLSIDTNSTDAGFLAGVLAAKMTKSRVVGCPAGLEIPGVMRYVYGFQEGVKYVDPEIKVLASYTGSFTDTAQLKELAAAMVQQGADILAPNADQAGLGAFEVVRENKDLRVIGVYGDQSSLAPEQTLVSAIIDMPGAMDQIAKLGAEGKLEAKSYVFGVKEGAVWLTEYLAEVPQDVRDYMDDIMSKMKDGTIAIDYDAH